MEGWQRIKAYSSDSSSVISSSSSSSEEEPLAFTAGKSPEQAKEKASKYKAALRTVLAALEKEADEDDHKLKRRLEKKKEKVKEKEKELKAVAAKEQGPTYGDGPSGRRDAGNPALHVQRREEAALQEAQRGEGHGGIQAVVQEGHT